MHSPQISNNCLACKSCRSALMKKIAKNVGATLSVTSATVKISLKNKNFNAYSNAHRPYHPVSPRSGIWTCALKIWFSPRVCA